MTSHDTSIRTCAVIGAGTMGSGIAAHLANAGADVVLLDMDADIARQGIERQIKAGGFMLPEFAARVRPGSIGADLQMLADRDWIVEAVAEKLEIKRSLFASIASVRKSDCIVSSNTSTIPLAQLLEGMDDSMATHMLITHFFNPPRQMRLLELVTSDRTQPDAVRRISHFLDHALGKSIVPCKDTPGFIANRIGCYWLAAGLNEAIRLGIDVELADAVMGKPFGLPRTGVFGLYDLIGVDLMPQIIRSLQDCLPAEDPMQLYTAEPTIITSMLANGHKGRKAGAGFYRIQKERKSREAIDLASAQYRPQHETPAFSTHPRELMDEDSTAGHYAWAVMSRTLAYAAALVPEIADRVDMVDEAMRLGYGWALGPFELIDRIGPEWFAARLARDGSTVPPLVSAAGREGFYRVTDGTREALTPRPNAAPTYTAIPVPDGVLTFPALRSAAQPVWTSEAASLRDAGDGVGVLEFHTKLNVFTTPLMNAVRDIITITPQHFQALVIGNDGPVFSAGADLKAMLALSEAGDRAGLEAFLLRGLETFAAVEQASFPIIGSVGALAVGGGCEILLHTHRVALHAEARIGLVEAQVGLLPGWGGVSQWLLRQQEAGLSPEASACAVLDGVLGAATCPGAFAARKVYLARASDCIVMNADRVLAQARIMALEEPVKATDAPRTITLPPRSAVEAHLDQILPTLSPHDRTIGTALLNVLGGTGTPEPLAAIDRRVTEQFLDLALTEPSRERIRHMISSGKPLKN